MKLQFLTKKELTYIYKHATTAHNKIRIMDNISINNNTNSNNVRHEVATNNDVQGIETNANQQNIVVVENVNNLPANQQNIGDRQLEQREVMQQAQVPAVDVEALTQRYQDLIECKDIGNGKYELSIEHTNISNEKAQEVLEAFKYVNVTVLNVNYCGELTKLNIQHFKNLENARVESCSELEVLIAANLPKLRRLSTAYHCPKLHGELDVSGSPLLSFVSIPHYTENFVIVIDSECPLAQKTLANDPRIITYEQPLNYGKYIAILIEKRDITAAKNIVQQIKKHPLKEYPQKKDCLEFFKSYCERYVSASEKAKAAEKYISALNRFSAYFDACHDAFATGLAKLKIELELGDLLDKCNTPKERRQVLFGVYTQEQIEQSIAAFSKKHQQIMKSGEANVASFLDLDELLTLQLAMNIILNVPYSKNMKYTRSALRTAAEITDVYNYNVNILRDLVVPGETFLATYNGIMPMFLEKAQTKLELDKNDAKLFEVPLKIVLTSMLRNDAVNKKFVDKKFNTFLLGEQEYLPLAAKTPEQIQSLTVGGLERITGETDNTIAIKVFIQEHKGQPIDPSDPDGEKLSDNSTLADVFFFLKNNNEEDNELYEKIAGMTSTKGVAALRQQSISHMYSEANYEAKLAKHLEKALRSNEQQQVNVNQPENDE